MLNSGSPSTNKSTTRKLLQPASFFRFITRLNGRHSLSKMSSDEEIRSKVMTICSNQSEIFDSMEMVNDSDSENHDDDADVESRGLVMHNEEQQQPADADFGRYSSKGIRIRATATQRSSIHQCGVMEILKS